MRAARATAEDLYERADGPQRRSRPARTVASGDFDAQHAGHSDDGARVFFETLESLVSADTERA